MQTKIKPTLSVYVNDKGTLFGLIYKNRDIEKRLPLKIFYLYYEDEKTAREAADIIFNDTDVRDDLIEKAVKLYEAEKANKTFQRNGWARRITLKHNIEKGFKKIFEWYMDIPYIEDSYIKDSYVEAFNSSGVTIKFSYKVMTGS